MIAQYPFDCASGIVDANEKVFPARDNQGVIRAIVSHGIAVKPIIGAPKTNSSGLFPPAIMAARYDGSHVPGLEELPFRVDLHDDRFEVGICVGLEKKPGLAAIHVMVEFIHACTGIVSKKAHGPIEIIAIEIETRRRYRLNFQRRPRLKNFKPAVPTQRRAPSVSMIAGE